MAKFDLIQLSHKLHLVGQWQGVDFAGPKTRPVLFSHNF